VVKIAAWVTVVTLAGASAASGHHSAAAVYDGKQSIDIAGTVREFSWRNPHCHLYIDVTDGPFKGQTYAVEMSSPGSLTEEGWTKTLLHVGDNVVVQVHPSLGGAPAGLCRSCTLTNNGTPTKPKILLD
jgi:hypothetical protein